MFCLARLILVTFARTKQDYSGAEMLPFADQSASTHCPSYWQGLEYAGLISIL